MTTAILRRRCEYLQTPPIFTSERAELVHITEQISLLDNHISQLSTLRDTLHHRSRQLSDLLSPVRKLPTEILSYIFQLLFLPDRTGDGNFHRYCKYSRQARALSTVSSHFRRIALGTPELWKRIPLRITNGRSVQRASFSIQRYITLAPSINISVWDLAYNKGITRSAIDIVLSSDAAQKVKSFELYESGCADLWTKKLNGPSFPMLDVLSISYAGSQDPRPDFGTLRTLTRLNLSQGCLHRPLIVPSSLQYLNIRHSTHQVLVSAFYQCPNLVEGKFTIDAEIFDDLDGDTQFTEPLTLNHLKRLTCCVLNVVETSSNLQLPALETLEIRQHRPSQSKLIKFIPLCHRVSATLTTLIINMYCYDLEPGDLYQLCRSSFPKLRKLEFFAEYYKPFLDAIHALALVDGECNNAGAGHLPALRSVTVRHEKGINPRELLDSLKAWRIGEAFDFHIQINYGWLCREGHWPLELQKELKSIIGGRRIEVT